nr:4Fe-4S dicluster domain-containing protein [uncultured Cohaesibacter sp.]
MSYEITNLCVNCHACMDVCPNDAISAGEQQGQRQFVISAKACTHCDGDYLEAQCASICPVEGAILNEFGQAVNPAGSLTGIPPERIARLVLEGVL